MGRYNFDEIIERRNTGSCKWDDYVGVFAGYDVSGALPMWVADMDFKCPDEVTAEVIKKAEHGIYGYPVSDRKGIADAVKIWLSRRLCWNIKQEWVVPTQGVIPAVTLVVQAFTEPGYSVLIQPPVYYPFKDRCIRNNGRIAAESCLIEKDGAYTIDLDDFERKASDSGTKLFILCSPHNPVGRVWTRDELTDMVEICKEHSVTIFSDEIHSDLIMNGFSHTATGLVSGSGDISLPLISAYAPSKTFNLAGLNTSVVIIPDRETRKKYLRQLNANDSGRMNIFGQTAFITAYTHGEQYLNELLEYLDGNLKYAREFISSNIPGVSASVTEGTYFLWVDFRRTGLDTEQINCAVLEKAKVAGDLGEWFGEGGSGFVRFNLACPRTVVEEAMQRLMRAFTE